MSIEAPPCHVCGKSVAVWRTEAPQEAVCVDCCAGVEHSDGETGHAFEYERGERTYMCRYCAAPPDGDFYDYLNGVGQP